MRIETVRLDPPAALLTCAPAPDVPVTDKQEAVANYLADLWAAGDDCRSKLKAVRTFVKESGNAQS